MSDFDIILEDAFDIKGEPAILMKISSEVVELNIYFELSELNLLANFATDKNMAYLKPGNSGDNPVHWKRDNGSAYILVGADTDVGNIGFTFTENLFVKIKQVLAK